MGLVSIETMRAKAGYENEVEEKRIEAEGTRQDSYDSKRQEEIDQEDEEESPEKKKKDEENG